MNKTAIVLAVVALAATLAPLPEAHAQATWTLQIGSAPPPPRYEAVPAPRRGQQWVAGYWNWNNNQHVWNRGHWERSRPGYVYQNAEWQQAGGQWDYRHGGWRREDEPARPHDGRRDYSRNDRDGDGVPNRQDRQPDNRRVQ